MTNLASCKPDTVLRDRWRVCGMGSCVRALKSSAFTDVLSNFHLMVNDGAHKGAWAGRLRNELKMKIIAPTGWWKRGKNIPAIHTLISDDDTLMKIKDGDGRDNYEEQNDKVEDFAICAAGFPPLCGFVEQTRMPLPSGALWYIMGLVAMNIKYPMKCPLSFPSVVLPPALWCCPSVAVFPFIQLIYLVYTSVSVHCSINQILLLIDSFC